ncbi:hypothetical protein ABMA27_005059 [Loxostege sticticalis]|uniref:Reverse transcriptase domain-containing protein n=1 Tax=Loxostege sticticalis TaxID=481309 RepID=A0ABR3HLP0_LOXSC
MHQYPDIQVTRQRLGDQRRAIIRNKLLPQSIIDNIYTEIQTELNEHSTPIIHYPSQNDTTSSTTNTFSQSQATQRTRWTDVHNEAIMRFYYHVTRLETDKTMNRRKIHQNFIATFPDLLHVTEQRVADQRRLIILNKLINEETLELIKQNVAEELQITDSTNTETNTNTQTATVDIPVNSQSQQTFSTTEHISGTDEHITSIINLDSTPQINTETSNLEINHTINSTFTEALQYFKSTNPTSRSYIPKQRSSKKLAIIVNYIDKKILTEHIDENTTYDTLQTILYCAAWTAAKVNGAKLSLPPRDTSIYSHKKHKPKWQIRLESKIEDLRAKIGRLTQYINGSRSRKLVKHVNKILTAYKIHTVHEEANTQLIHFLDTLKQKLSVLSSRLKRYTTCTLRKTQNNQFTNNEKQFYRNMNTTNNSITPRPHTTAPSPDNMKEFWSAIWENSHEHNQEAEWIQTEQQKFMDMQEMDFQLITWETFVTVLNKLHNWKTPGSDHIHNYWLKKFTHAHKFLHYFINYFIKNPDTIPEYVMAGITYMIPKDSTDTSNPAKYRPITCLQTTYKLLTSCITDTIYKHIDQNQILTEQQKGCRRSSQGCKEQLTIDSVILRQVQKIKGNLFSMYIDYKKAYDSVPHSWLLEILNIYKIHPVIKSFLGHVITKWKTRLQFNTGDGIQHTNSISIRRGIFQGDALSPLWFCLALNPLSNLLNSILITKKTL